MSLKHLIFTEPGLTNPRWQQAMPDAVIIDNSSQPTVKYDIVWVLTNTADWQQRIRFYSTQGAIVIAITRFSKLPELQQALQAGAKGYLDFMSNNTILTQAVQSIQAGALWLPVSLLTSLTGTLSQVLNVAQSEDEILSVLSSREQQVARCVLKGCSNKEVARRLEITERTVKEHLSAIFNKLGISDRFQLILKVRS